MINAHVPLEDKDEEEEFTHTEEETAIETIT